MKVGLICPYNMFKGGGVQECVIAMQRELRKLGHNTIIITPLPRGEKARKLPHAIFIGMAKDVKSPFHTTAQVSISLDTDEIDKMLAAEKFDILHFHEPWVPMVSRQILARSTCINVATFHAKLPDNTMSRTIEKVITPYTRSIMKYLHALTAVSDAAAEYVKTLVPQEVAIIPNGIDLSTYNFSSNASTSKILYLGRLERRKGVKYLLKAFANLSQKDSKAELIIVGDGPDGPKLKQYVKEQKIPRVSFHGYVDHKKKLQLLAQARVFVSPALYGESFGIVLLEAMAAGVPVVAGDNPGYATVLKQTGELSLVNPRETDEFSRRLHMMLHNEEVRELWQGWAESYVQQFDYAKVVLEYEKLYKRLLTSD